MNRKGFDGIFYLCLYLLCNFSYGSDVWDDSPVGQCVRKIDVSQNKITGARVVKEKDGGAKGEKYVWFFDATPSRNATRVLYEIKKIQHVLFYFCLMLICMTLKLKITKCRERLLH